MSSVLPLVVTEADRERSDYFLLGCAWVVPGDVAWAGAKGKVSQDQQCFHVLPHEGKNLDSY